MILAIDGTNQVHILWHAQSGTGVIAALRNRLAALQARIKPSRTVVCFDRRSFRHDIYPDYKAQRKPKDEGLLRDLDDAQQALADRARIVAVEGFEADDCLASLAHQTEEQVILASSDKDLRQCLVAGRVTILKEFSTYAGEIVKLDWYNADRLFAEFHLRPEQWIDFQALVGDASDNVPGCRGWGPVVSGRALKARGSLQAILDNPLAVKTSAKQYVALLAFRDQAALMRRLVTLRTDVPLKS